MPSTFLAPPLPQKGESFVLVTTHQGKDVTIVVDTGRELKQSHLDIFLQSNLPDLVRIDKLILTHEDADHCEGAPQFIANWLQNGGQIGEVWLPSMWAVAGAGSPRTGWTRSRIVKGAFEAAKEISDQVDKLRKEGADLKRRPQLSEKDLLSSECMEVAIRNTAKENEAFAGIFEPTLGEKPTAEILMKRRLEIQDNDDQRHWRFSDYRYWPPIEGALEDEASNLALMLDDCDELNRCFNLSGFALHLAKGALDSHPRIAKTIAACLAYGLPIRWFDFGQFEASRIPAGGDANFLTPVNAVEVRIKQQSVTPKQMFLALTLSRANRECLSFLRHEDGTEPAVLFTGDSRLSTSGLDFPSPSSGLPTNGNMLTNAMHHASASNEQGYSVLKSWLGQKYPPLFVRNGGQGVRNAAKSYLASPNRLCVRCIGSNRADVTIRVDAYCGQWTMPNHPPKCSCN
jgi:Metallo-beta-lactamase superfamily